MENMRGLDDQRDLERFLALKAERDRIDSELADLKPAILCALHDEDGGRFDIGSLGLRLEIGYRKTYAFSDELKDLEADVKLMKQREIASGTAEMVRHTSFVVVKKVKS
jgi:hypothetical protein